MICVLMWWYINKTGGNFIFPLTLVIFDFFFVKWLDGSDVHSYGSYNQLLINPKIEEVRQFRAM